MGKTWKQSFQIAFTYIGTVVGAGFASGREILEFFVRYGTQGLIGILLASVLFVWAGIRVMILAHRIRANSYQDISEYLFGKSVGTLFNYILAAVLLGTSSVMLAASGSLFANQFHLSPQAGIWLTMLAAYVVSVRGLTAIHSVNSLFVPVLIVFTLLVFLHHQPWNDTLALPVTVEVVKPWIWFSAPLYYTALNVTLTQSVLVPIGRESESERPLVIGGLLGGIGIGVLLLLVHLTMHSHLPDVERIDMPMIYLLSGLGKATVILFSLIVYAEVFSSLIANVFGLVEQFKHLVPLSAPVLTFFILSVCYLVSFVGFTSLLSILYPLFGQIVVLFLVMLWVKHMYPKHG